MPNSRSNKNFPKVEDVEEAVKNIDLFRVRELLSSITDDNQLADFLNQKFGDIYSEKTLIHTAAGCDVDILKYFLKCGGNVDCLDFDGRTPLHLAAVEGKPEIVRYLVSKGARVNCQDDNGMTALHLAAKQGEMDIAQYLVSEGAIVDCKDEERKTPLYWAAKQGELDVLKYLVSEGANVNCKDEDGRTPLHPYRTAMKLKGKLEIVQYLVSKGANVENKDNNGITPLHSAVREGTLDIVKYLVSEGANVNCKDDNGRTPLHEVMKGKLEIVRYLVSKGANVENKDNNGITPLHSAVREGALDIVKYLVSEGANVNCKDKNGRTPLNLDWKRLELGKLEIVQYLVSKGANVEIRDNNGVTLLHSAARGDKLKIMKYLVSEGANVNCKDKNGRTPLHWTARGVEKRSTRWLLDNGADINAKDNKGNTSLHAAVMEKKPGHVSCLLQHRYCDVDIRNNNGKTAEEIANNRRYSDVIKEFKELPVRKILFAIDDGDADALKTAADNADINGYCEEETPLLYAVSNGSLDMIKTLCSFGEIDVNKGNESGETPLIKAIELEKGDIVKFLSAVEGININQKNKSGQTPLSKAVELEKEDFVKFLCTLEEIDLNNKTESGDTPLSKAVKLKNESIIKILCKIPGVDIEHKDWETANMQNILYQSQIFYPLLVRMVMRGCNKFDVSIRNRLGDTVAHMAVKSELIDGIEMISKLQDDVHFSARNQDDKTAFDILFPENVILSDQDHTPILQMACRTDGKDVATRKDSNGKTVSHLAAMNKSYENREAFIKLYEKHKADIDVNAADKDGNTTLSLAVQNKMDDVTLIILSDPRLNIDSHGELQMDGYHVLKEIVHRNNSTENDEFDSILKNYLSDTAVPKNPLKNVPFTLEKLFEKADDKISVLDEFRMKIADESSPEYVKKIYTALLNITLIGLQQHAKHKNLQYTLYKGSVIKTFVQIFVDLNDERINDSDYLTQLLRVLYISTQANIKCDCGSRKSRGCASKTINETGTEEQVMNTLADVYKDMEVSNAEFAVERTQANVMFGSESMRNTGTKVENSLKEVLSESLARTLGEELHRKFTEQVKKISLVNEDKEVSNAELIATGIQNAYFEEGHGCFDSFEKTLTKASEEVSKCLHLRRVFHKCVRRGDFAFILCFLSIFIQSSDIVSDAMVGLKTFYGFSKRLGIFIIALVLATLVHENIRSVISAYETDQDLLRITLGRKDLKDEDIIGMSDLNYYIKCSNPIYRSCKRFLWTFKVCDESGNFTKNSIKHLIFNLLSLLMLRPVVDRLIVLSHSPSHLRAIYRQQAKQKSLNQYYMILEQMPELLIQFYVFQIYFNNLKTSEDYKNYGCTKVHTFIYRTEYFECVQNLWRLKICASWWEVYSMLVPFFKIPHSMVSLEKMFRLLSPETPKMSAAASVFLYIAYILMIPSRLFLFAAVMHSATSNLYVMAYLGLATLIWLIINLYVKIRRKKDLEEEAYEDKKERKWTAKLGIKTIWSLLLFTLRDDVVISLRSADAYLLPPSEVNYKTLRSWKKILAISSYYFAEGVVGAVFVEHCYPCGRNSEIFKFQGWLYLVLLIISVTIITLLSYILQPTKIYIIPRQFLKSAALICSLGFVMWLVAALIFHSTTRKSATDIRLPLIIATLIILFVFLVVVVILRYFSEAKVKKSKKEATRNHDTSKDKNCCSRQFCRFLCCGGTFKCLCCSSYEGTTVGETLQCEPLPVRQKNNLDVATMAHQQIP